MQPGIDLEMTYTVTALADTDNVAVSDTKAKLTGGSFYPPLAGIRVKKFM